MVEVAASKERIKQQICLFVLTINVPVNNFSVMSGRAFLG